MFTELNTRKKHTASYKKNVWIKKLLVIVAVLIIIFVGIIVVRVIAQLHQTKVAKGRVATARQREESIADQQLYK